MTRTKNLQDLFKRYRRPGDFVFAMCFFLLSVFLLVNLPWQTEWVERTKLFAQPAFWPTIAIIVMVLFGLLHLYGAYVSERIPGRLAEVLYWARSVEYAVWFLVYAFVVPVIGYLLATIVFTILLTYRQGYRGWKWVLFSVLFSVCVVVGFKAFLQVKIPAGAIYEWLPSGLRSFMMTYL